MKVRPMNDHLFIERHPTEVLSPGGIWIPSSAQERPCGGTVLASGPGKRHPKTGVRIPNRVSEGDSVLFAGTSGLDQEVGDRTLLVLRDDDILAIVHPVEEAVA